MKIKISSDVVRRFVSSIFLLVVALAAWSLVGCSEYTTGDAAVDNQSMGAAQEIQKEAQLAKAAADSGSVMAALDSITAIAKDIETNAKTEMDLHKPSAGYPLMSPYSHPSTIAAQQQATADHSTPWYLKIIYGVGAVLLGAGGMAAAAYKIPFVGNLLNSVGGKALGALLSHVGDIHGKAQAGTLTATDVVSGVGDLLDDPAIKPIEDKLLTALHIGGHTTPTDAAVAASAPASVTVVAAAPVAPAAPAAPAPAIPDVKTP